MVPALFIFDMQQEQAIDDPRTEIDNIDRALLHLLNERASIALKVGEAKASSDRSLYDPRRESDVIARLCRDNHGPLADAGIESIFKCIIDESLHLQQKTYARSAVAETNAPCALVRGDSRVGILGGPGTFSEQAASSILAEGAQTVSFPTIDDVFGAIPSKQADYILTPIENTVIGSLHRNYVLLIESGLNIVGEVLLPVSHFLIGPDGATLETIKRVESHPAALGQCEQFFSAHPDLRRIESDDTAGSVRRAIESGDMTRAAIGSRRAAEIYGGNILLENIEDVPENYTRFLLLARGGDEQRRGDKISILLHLVNRPGSLHNALRPFVRRGIDLLKIESMPIRHSPGQFYFYMDLRAPGNEGEFPAALSEIREQAEEVRLLGRYQVVEANR